MESETETRIGILETQVAFLEDTVGALDAALAGQQQKVFELQDQLRLLHQQIKEQGSRLDSFDAPADQPPPHY